MSSSNLCPYCFPEQWRQAQDELSQSSFGNTGGRFWLHQDGIYEMEPCRHYQLRVAALAEGRHGPIRSGHGPLRDGHGPLRDGHGPLRDGHGPLRDSHGPLRDGHGPLRDGHGPLRDGTGPIRNVMGRPICRGLGYLPDPYDSRDHDVDVAPESLVKPILRRLFGEDWCAERKGRGQSKIVKSIDSRAKEFQRVWKTEPAKAAHDLVDGGHTFSPIEDQAELGSCTAHAVVGLIEYLHRREAGESLDLSRMFLYYNSRRLDGFYGDSGSYIRSTIKATTALGAVPEQHWPYEAQRLDWVPDSFCYALASNYRSLAYVRLDQKQDLARLDDGKRRDWVEALIRRLKQSVLGGYPVAVGFLTPPGISNAPMFPIPPAGWTPGQDGHAVLIVGYDDEKDCGPGVIPGAFKVRNSWGVQWGEDGYGYLPYHYVEMGLVHDCWTILYWEALANSFA